MPRFTSESLPTKVAFCNLSSYGSGDEKEGCNILSWKVFCDWMWKPSRTICKTALFVYALLEKLDGKPLPGREPAYSRGLFAPYMQRVCYMNLDQEVREGEIEWTTKDPSTGKSPCDWTRIFYKRWWNRFTMRDLIAVLEPDIFIVTGVTPYSAGYELLNHIYKHDGPDVPENARYTGDELWLNNKNNNFKRLGKTLFVSIPHPSRGYGWNNIVDTLTNFHSGSERDDLPPMVYTLLADI